MEWFEKTTKDWAKRQRDKWTMTQNRRAGLSLQMAMAMCSLLAPVCESIRLSKPPFIC